MKYGTKMLYLSQGDLIQAGCFNISEIIFEIEKALLNFGDENIIFPNKIAMIFDEASQSRINCLPGGFYDKNVYGMKWISVFPDNPKKYELPNLSAVILLSEISTGTPIAFMDGVLCSNLRTAGVSAVAAKYLARKDSETIGFIGAGEQAKTHLMTLKNVLPTLKICKVSSRTEKTEKIFIKQMSRLYPDIQFVPCKCNYKSAVEGSDIIVTAISGQEKILQSEWIDKGTFYCHVAGLEDDYSVAKKADKIVCDEWEVVKHRTQTISRMYQEGKLSDENIYGDLHELVKKQKIGRENSDEFIYFNSVGLSYIDIAIAFYMYNKALQYKIGKPLVLNEKSLFEYDAEKIVK